MLELVGVLVPLIGIAARTADEKRELAANRRGYRD
jgi:hypothetical protein